LRSSPPDAEITHIIFQSMERIMLPVLMLLALVVAGQGAQITVYRIHLNADGSALWTIEHKYPLGEKTSSDLFEWASNNLGSLAVSYKTRLESIVSKISSQLRRPMSVENLSITAKVTDTLSGSVGVIRVEFVWRGFARLLEDSKIEVGDVFIGGLVLLDGESLRSVLPEGMSISEI